MNVILVGATGMIGQAVLRRCLEDDSVTRVLSIGRSSTSTTHRKFHELIVPDLTKAESYERELVGYDACFWSAGVTALGLDEAEYSRITYDITLAFASTLARLAPDCTFLYISGAGADSSERGRVMWARVKGRTENALVRLSDRTYIFRPGLIIPLDGIRSRTSWYNAAYAVARPLYPLLRRMGPGVATTTRQLAAAMLAVGRSGFPRRILEMADINAL